MASATGGSNWKKAKFYNADTGSEVVECHFNPNDFTITRTNQWQSKRTSGSGPAGHHVRRYGRPLADHEPRLRHLRE